MPSVLSAAELRLRLDDLYLERRAAEPAGLDRYAPYMDDLLEEIAECRLLFTLTAVTEIAVLRGELSGRRVG